MHQRLFGRLLALTISLLFAAPGFAKEPLELVTGVWPPFISVEGANQGILTQIVQAAFERVGQPTTVIKRPWNRVRRMVNDHQAISFGWSWGREYPKPWYYSDTLLETVDVFAERRIDPVRWDSIESLMPYRIGVVKGYNLPFMVEQKRDQLKTILAPSDESNLRMLLAHRADVVIINPRVAHYLLDTQFDMQDRAGVALQADHPITSYTLHLVCHKLTETCAQTIVEFNEGLRLIRNDGTWDRITHVD